MVKVAVVILNFKVKDLTLECVSSVRKSSYKAVTIYVIDNASDDGIDQAIKQFNDVHFIQTGGNLGYTGGNNIGIKKALSDDCDVVFILNPDTTVDPQVISECVKVMDQPEVGIVGPKVLFDDKQTIWYAGGILDKASVIGKHRGVDEKDCGQYDDLEETDYVSGAAMVVKREVFEQISFFDERYFLYYEDSDFCLQAKKAGFKVMYAPKAVVYHQNAQSTGLGSPLQDYYITRNRMLFASKFLPLRTQLALYREVLRNISISSRRKALFDFLIGRVGRGSI